MLNATRMAEQVYLDHLAIFPDAVDVQRENTDTGVPKHNPSYEFIKALCAGLVAALQTAVVEDLGSGDDDVVGESGPVPFVITGIPQAVANFIQVRGWSGPNAFDGANILIGSVLVQVQVQAKLQMADNQELGTGNSIISPATNANFQTNFAKRCGDELAVAFKATGFFGEGDIPSAPVNTVLVDQLQGYADAYAEGLASLIATVSYDGAGGGSSISDVINTGSFL